MPRKELCCYQTLIFPPAIEPIRAITDGICQPTLAWAPPFGIGCQEQGNAGPGHETIRCELNGGNSVDGDRLASPAEIEKYV